MLSEYFILVNRDVSTQTCQPRRVNPDVSTQTCQPRRVNLDVSTQTCQPRRVNPDVSTRTCQPRRVAPTCQSGHPNWDMSILTSTKLLQYSLLVLAWSIYVVLMSFMSITRTYDMRVILGENSWNIVLCDGDVICEIFQVYNRGYYML